MNTPTAEQLLACDSSHSYLLDNATSVTVEFGSQSEDFDDAHPSYAGYRIWDIVIIDEDGDLTVLSFYDLEQQYEVAGPFVYAGSN